MGTNIPERSEFRHPDEVLVHVKTRPDCSGRQTFLAFWLTDQPWVPNGVRGQVFSTVLDEFTARHGEPVRIWKDDSGEPPEPAARRGRRSRTI